MKNSAHQKITQFRGERLETAPLMPKKCGQTANLRNIYLVGTQIGKCPLCKRTKKVLLLSYGFRTCEECLNVCVDILRQLQEVVDNRENVSCAANMWRRRSGFPEKF